MPGENELWLPELVYPETPGQIDAAYLDRLYQIFERDFVLTKPEWPGLRFALKRMPLRDGYASTFWHLISEGPVESDRAINIERCTRIGWPRVLVDAYLQSLQKDDPHLVNWWRQQRGRAERLVISTKDFSYVAVVDERKEYALLWTAFPVAPHARRRFEAQFVEFWE